VADPIEIDLPLVVGRRRRGRVLAGKPLTLNNAPSNPYAKTQLTNEIREKAGWAAKAAMREHRIGPQQHISAQLHYQPGDARTRDTDNLIASQKPAVDGLVDAGLIPDDNPTHLTWWAPAIHPERGPRRLWLAIHLTQENAA
jgi:crossover junction endodeoxyribonuclease RusA